MPTSNRNNNKQPAIFVVSGGRGIAGNSMVQSLLIQYPDNNLPVEIIPHILNEQQVFDIVLRAKAEAAIITHTMVDPELRAKFNQFGEEFGVPTIDFMGKLAGLVEEKLGIPPLKSPGLYREVNHAYFDRVEAIEFTLGHDDGVDARRLNQAEIVLTGLSRSGKTPLSVYLAMYGWKVANVPLIKGIDPPNELYEIDPQRVFGLHINASQLLAHRTKRMKSWGHNHSSDYIDERSIREEIRLAMFIFDKGNFTIMNVSNKPIESTANEILQIMNERFRYGGRKLESPYGNTSEV